MKMHYLNNLKYFVVTSIHTNIYKYKMTFRIKAYTGVFVKCFFFALKIIK